jgi:CBS domain-containing protein
MLRDIWKRGVDISEISSQAGMKMPTVEVSTAETASKLVKMMLQRGVNSIVVTENQKPIGMINDREILKDIVENQKNPEKVLVKDLKYTPLIILNGEESMMHALKMMREQGMKRVAVVKNGQLVGMLTNDFAKKASSPLESQVH